MHYFSDWRNLPSPLDYKLTNVSMLRKGCFSGRNTKEKAPMTTGGFDKYSTKKNN